MSDPTVARAHRQVIAAILLVAALVTAVGIFAMLLTGGVAAQSTSPTAEVPGLDAGESGNITVSVAWNGNATVDDTATVTIDHVLEDGSIVSSDEHTINADPSATTNSTFAVSPAEDVSYFQVTTEAVEQNVSSVTVTSDIEADTDDGGGGGALLGGSATPVAAVVVVVIVAIGLARRADQ